MQCLLDKYNVESSQINEHIGKYGYLTASKMYAEKLGDSIDNAYISGALYVMYIRQKAMNQKKLLETNGHIFNEFSRSFMIENYDYLTSIIVEDRDFLFKYNSAKAIKDNYLVKIDGEPVETIQWMWMRIAVQVSAPENWRDIPVDTPFNRFTEVKNTYDMLSTKQAIHATPTCVNSGLRNQQMESCFCIDIGDSMEEIADAYKLLLMGSKCNGGFGIYCGRIRHSTVHGRGVTKGIPGLLFYLFNNVIQYADQLGSRPGACTAYFPIWHADAKACIGMKNSHNIALRAEKLHYAVCLYDYFYECVIQNKDWYFFCPRQTQILWAKTHGIDINNTREVDKCPSLCDFHGEEFKEFYIKCVEANIYSSKMNARELEKLLHSEICQIGEPFIFDVDNVNRKSNDAHLGTIVQSNLCVHGDTKITTQGGDIPISMLAGSTISIWNGFEWSSVSPIMTGRNQSLTKLTFSNGSELLCTPYHKFHIMDGNSPQSIMVECSNLSIGNRLIPWMDPFTEKLVEPATVESITPDFCVSDTFCFTEPKRNMGIFNGVIAGNCTEIMQYTKPSNPFRFSKDNNGVPGIFPTCDLATINIAAFYVESSNTVNWDGIGIVTRQLVRNLDRVLDRTSGILDHTGQSLIDECMNSNDPSMKVFAEKLRYYVKNDPTYTARMRNRAFGIGFMGLASLFASLGIKYGSKESLDTAVAIRACIYWHAMDESANLAQGISSISDPNVKPLGSYETFEGSSTQKGVLQPHTWIEENTYMSKYENMLNSKEFLDMEKASLQIKDNDSFRYKRINFKLINPKKFGIHDTWESLSQKVMKGMRNAKTTCQMPNATTGDVFGVSAGSEPFYEIMYVKSTDKGSVQNIYDVFRDVMVRNNVYDSELMANYLCNNHGRIEGLHTIYEDQAKRDKLRELEELFPSSFHVNKVKYLGMIQQMGMYIDQGQSLNMFYEKPNAAYMARLSRYAWLNGRKTQYYVQRLASGHSISDKELKSNLKQKEIAQVCTRDNPECKSCQ